MYVYTLFDRLAKEAGPLYEAKADIVAARAVQRMFAMKQAESFDSRDFVLLRLASWDKELCKLVPEPSPVEVHVDLSSFSGGDA